jgi:Asp-tRNA(Asn)/Glu-tRNA(Gln) amidotransferase A subunit family amidase
MCASTIIGFSFDPAYCTIWTLAGLPCINAPLFVGSSGLPMGLQLIGASQHDDRLLRTTSWLLQFLQLN